MQVLTASDSQDLVKQLENLRSFQKDPKSATKGYLNKLIAQLQNLMLGKPKPELDQTELENMEEQGLPKPEKRFDIGIGIEDSQSFSDTTNVEAISGANAADSLGNAASTLLDTSTNDVEMAPETGSRSDRFTLGESQESEVQESEKKKKEEEEESTSSKNPSTEIAEELNPSVDTASLDSMDENGDAVTGECTRDTNDECV